MELIFLKSKNEPNFTEKNNGRRLHLFWIHEEMKDVLGQQSNDEKQWQTYQTTSQTEHRKTQENLPNSTWLIEQQPTDGEGNIH